MAHDVHTTNALVLASTDVQDADKLLWLLTQDFGLVFASAKSVRREVSKLRYALQDLSLARVSLVQGRGMWRLTGAQEEAPERLSSEASAVFGRIATLVRRVLPTDEEQGAVFTCLASAREALALETMSLEVIERVTVARVLYQLGYVTRTPAYQDILDTHHFDTDVIARGEELGEMLVADINNGLYESQL